MLTGGRVNLWILAPSPPGVNGPRSHNAESGSSNGPPPLQPQNRSFPGSHDTVSPLTPPTLDAPPTWLIASLIWPRPVDLSFPSSVWERGGALFFSRRKTPLWTRITPGPLPSCDKKTTRNSASLDQSTPPSQTGFDFRRSRLSLLKEHLSQPSPNTPPPTMFPNLDLIQDQGRVAPWVKTTPLVLLHDGGGTTFAYHCLGRLNRTVYGISNPYFKTDKKWKSLTEMARHYAGIIRKTIPHGNVILGGWSLGGLVCLEVAKILREEVGPRVMGIVMIDSSYPRAPKGFTPSLPYNPQWSKQTRQETKDAVTQCFSEAMRIVAEWPLPTWGDEEEETGRTVVHARLPNPKCAPPPVILLRAQDPVPGDGVSRVDQNRGDRKLGWNRYRPAFLTQIVDIPGHHFNIFSTEENLEAVTAKLKKACEDLEGFDH
ncbi:Alpha/Beta hydrolase protein [Podospora conica]|nr:Alpha/Beta hydrolase protein [Schizothecium conicum]